MRGQVTRTYFPPPDDQGGWRTLDDPRDIRRVAGMDLERLDQAFAYAKTSTKNGGLLVARRGWLVYERYFGKGSRDATPNLASCGKSFTSIAVGMLVSQRPDCFPEGLEQRIFRPAYLPAEAFPLSDPRKSEIKLGQLLSFSAGIRGNNPCYVDGAQTTIEPIGPDGWQALVDDVALGMRDGVYPDGRGYSAATLWCAPGGGYSYATASIHLASIMLRHITGRELQDYLAEHLARPLGWGRWGFGYRHAAEVTHTPGGGGVALHATDMLRFAYLLLRGGRWEDDQVAPAEYVRHCGGVSPYNPHYPYSLQCTANKSNWWPELPRDAYWKAGSGGHAFYVVPSLDLVAWKLGGRDEQYSQANTGLPEVPGTDPPEARQDWVTDIDASVALRRTLELVVAATA